MIFARGKLPIILLTSIFVVLALVVLPLHSVVADEQEDKLQKLNEEIIQYEKEIDRLKDQANTLSNQIAQFDAQINLTTLKISQTEEKIASLGDRIDRLEISLQSLSNAFSSRAAETYKMSKVSEPVYMIISANDMGDAVSTFHYLQKVQEADRSLLVRLQKAQGTYKTEKKDQEDLQAELEDQKKVLGAQKTAKAELLQVTRNDEKRYQQLLSKARAELVAIQAIIAGKGKETEAGHIDQGSRIASIIPGSSVCSSGGHLHFEVVKDSSHQNPTNFLSNKGVEWDNAPDSPFSFNGSWQWPLNDPVRITQGYGMTFYASTLRYYGGAPHTGIDMVNQGDYSVKAVKPGTLYRGSIACGGGTLRYVHIEQEDGYDTYYLHVNY